MTSGFPQMDKAITPRAVKLWGGAIIAIGASLVGSTWAAAGAWDNKVDKRDLVAALAERQPHHGTVLEVRELRRATTALQKAVAVNMTRAERIPEMSEDLKQATAQIQVLTAVALAGDAAAVKRRALRRAAQQIRAAAARRGDDDPLAGVEGL